MPETRDDGDCVARCLNGDVEAFAPLVERYQRVLFSVARRMLSNDEDARDVTQNTFLKAYVALRSYDPERKFFSWLYRIAVNESLNMRRNRRDVGPLPPEVAVAGGQMEAVEASERTRRIREALNRLPEDYREVIVLRHFADLSYQEISDATGVPESTVKSRLFSGRRRLGELMASTGG